MKPIKFFALFLTLCFNPAFAIGTWCGYSEFISGNDNAEAQKQIVNMRANFCNGQPGTNGVPTEVTVKSLNGTTVCTVQNTTIADNLLIIGTPAYPTLRISDPETIRTNMPALYLEIFGCK